MRVAGVAVLAAELATAIGVDGPLEREIALADGTVEDGAGAHGAELDPMAVVGVGRLRGEARHADGDGGKDRKEGRVGLS